MELRNQLQRAMEAYDLLEQTLPLPFKGQFTKVRKDATGFPDKPPGRELYAKLRVMPTTRDVPEFFWSTSWCFYVIGVGRLDASYDRFPISETTDGHVMFQMPHGLGACGKGKHQAEVDRILRNAMQVLGSDWVYRVVPKKDGDKAFLIKSYRPDAGYPADQGMPAASLLAQDLADLIDATYPEFLKYGGGV
jgi:hypothetical protein